MVTPFTSPLPSLMAKKAEAAGAATTPPRKFACRCELLEVFRARHKVLR